MNKNDITIRLEKRFCKNHMEVSRLSCFMRFCKSAGRNVPVHPARIFSL